MTLFEFITTYHMNKSAFSAELGINESSLYKYINQERIPRLDIAIMIYERTRGHVTYRDMLPTSIVDKLPPPPLHESVAVEEYIQDIVALFKSGENPARIKEAMRAMIRLAIKDNQDKLELDAL